MQHQRIPSIIIILIAAAVLIVPLKIMGYGYIPPDDASRHAAKVISGRDWNEILVIRGDIKMDSHPGWHFILKKVRDITGGDVDTLILFSVVALFVLFSCFPLAMLERPESWIIALLAVSVASPLLVSRLFLGRPYIVMMTAVMAIGLWWAGRSGRQGRPLPVAILTLLLALSTWIHGGWYLFVLPVISFFLARQWRAGLVLSVSAVIGIMVGATLTGHPILFIRQMTHHVLLSLNCAPRLLVTEFKPFAGDFSIVIIVSFMLVWRALRKASAPKLIDDPIFIIAALSWMAGFVTLRIWCDIGLPALMLWIALEFQEYIKNNVPVASLSRGFMTVALCAVFYLAFTSDFGSRWTANLTNEYLSAEDPGQAVWLPEAGGIIYSDSMDIFYQTFSKNPHAGWRYILGFEPAWMPPEDLAIYRKIQWNYGAWQAFMPWVKKMTRSDRLILRRPPEQKPQIPGLEWYYAATNTWIGRLPRTK